ncbi:MAG: hypothetical protein JRD89_00910 [Deltaproteobacteria bacterium]|nr:hypothetical protein [Deltaproteobacteria bacterium]
MKARFGREIFCQHCGKDDRIVTRWRGKFSYFYWCERCRDVVKETDWRSAEVVQMVEDDNALRSEMIDAQWDMLGVGWSDKEEVIDE